MNFDYKRLVKFEHNVNDKEKKLRLIAGSIAILISLFLANILLLLIGLMLVTTSYVGWCPAYSAIGKPVCSSDEQTEVPVEKEIASSVEKQSAEKKEAE
jgi:hypothetical protein